MLNKKAIPVGRQGFTLMEAVVSIAVFALITSSLFSLFYVGIKMINNDKARIGARTLAEEKMEIIRNLPYNEVGTVGGIPSGEINSTEAMELTNTNYTIHTDIRYVDDTYDDLAPIDLVNIDYKQVRISVSWPTQIGADPVTLVTNVVPQDMENLEGGGTLWIEVYDSAPAPVANATIQIINNEVIPAVNISSETNAQGQYILPGALVSTQNYQVLITKNGYSSAQTYDLDIDENPNPDPAHLSVGEGDVTNKTFFIDLLSNLNIHAQTYDTGTAINDFIFTLQGNKTIGADGEGIPIYKYEIEHTTAGEGDVALNNIEADTYSLIFEEAVTGYDLAGSDPLLPYILAPEATTNLTLLLAPHADHTLLVTVKDAGGESISEPQIRLYKEDLAYDQTTIGSTIGQAFFTPLDFAIYNLEVTKDGYEIFNIEVNVEGQSEQEISMVAL